MMADRRFGLPFKRRALHPVLCIIYRLLIGALSHCQPLQPHLKTGMVHHAEHDIQTLIFSTDQIAYGAAILTILQNSCRRALNTQFLFDRQAMHIILPAKRPIFIHQIFRHNKDRNPLYALWCIWQPRQHKMDDILSHIMLTIGDIDFLASDQIMIPIFNRFGFDRRQICAGLRLCQIHCASPAPFDHWRQKQRFLGLRC